ncbi:hypothetical protein Btru_075434 [Bulinus truncatus]|nr:hypothetical protein Btru_075434 [Bulinus truncatus]
MSEEKVVLSEIDNASKDKETFFLQTSLKKNGLEGFNLILINGEEVWQGSVSEDDLDQMSTKIKMDYDKFVSHTRAALTGDITRNSNFECHFTKQGDKLAQIMWKNILDRNVKYHLGSTALKKCNDTPKKICDILSSCVANAHSQQEQIHSLELENERLSSERQIALKRLEKCVAVKVELEKDLYSKFVAVLNSKKERIRQLEEQIRSQDHSIEETPNSPASSLSKHELAPSVKNVRNQRKKQVQARFSASTSEDSPSDSEVTPAKKERKSKKTPTASDIESSLNLGEDEEKCSVDPPMVRRPRRQASSKITPAKPVLPRVSSGNTKAERRSSMRKSGSGNSNKSSDNLDPEDLLDDF